MTGKELYSRFQSHSAFVTPSWSQLDSPHRVALEGLAKELTDEQLDAVIRAVERRETTYGR